MKSAPINHQPGLNVGDIVYVLKRHKWKLLVVTIVGLAAAAAYFVRAPKLFQSQAKLLVRYVVERNAVDQVEEAMSTTAGRGVGDSVIQSEIQILTSWDLVAKVATLPEIAKLMSSAGIKSADVIGSGLTVNSVAKGSNVILASYKSPDPEFSRKVLDQLIKIYFERHLEIHRAAESLGMVQNKLSESSTTLGNLEAELQKLKMGSNRSLVEETASLMSDLSRARSELGSARVQLAEQQALVQTMEKLSPGPAPDPQLNVVRRAIPSTETGPPQDKTEGGVSQEESSAPEPEDVARYRVLMVSLQQMSAKRQELLSKWAPASGMVRRHDEQVREFERQRKELDERFPNLAALVFGSGMVAGTSGNFDLLAERGKLAGVEAKTQALEKDVTVLEKKASDLALAAPTISKLERTREVEEGNLRYMGSSLVRAEVDATLNPETMPNISIVQQPTPATPDVKQRNQIAMAIAAGTPATAIAIALLWGLFLDRSVKRPQNLEAGIGSTPLLTIPRFKGRGKLGLPSHARGKLTYPRGAEIAPWDPGHFIHSYAEAIRDRLSIYFESRQITHKPKLIGVSGFDVGSGTSTLAAGLAAALSRTGDGKVLLVDMNGTAGAAHPFFAGRPAISLDAALSPAEELQSTSENLYLAKAEPNANGSSNGLIKLRRLMDDLKASEFDYLIFDLPALAQLSPAVAMAGLMDQVLLVVEAEKTSLDDVRREYGDITSRGTAVSLILNKARFGRDGKPDSYS